MLNHLQAWGLYGILCLFRTLPPLWAARLGGYITRFIGPKLALSRIARTNLAIAFPSLKKAEIERIVKACWQNIGTTLAELPHLASLPAHTSSGLGWYVQHEDILYEAKKTGRPIIFFSGHLGNWELMPLILARYGLPFSPFYRAPNNPLVDQLLCKLRRRIVGQDISFFPKGRHGARDAMRHLANGKHLGVLGDQKMNDGIQTSFFGRPTMSAPATATLDLKYNALIITGHVWRKGPAQLILEVTSLIDPSTCTNDAMSRHEKVYTLTQKLNDQLQDWITQRPEEWLWFHRRWEKSLYR